MNNLASNCLSEQNRIHDISKLAVTISQVQMYGYYQILAPKQTCLEFFKNSWSETFKECYNLDNIFIFVAIPCNHVELLPL